MVHRQRSPDGTFCKGHSLPGPGRPLAETDPTHLIHQGVKDILTNARMRKGIQKALVKYAKEDPLGFVLNVLVPLVGFAKK